MTYQEMCTFEVLYQAYLEARKRKRSKPKTAQYEANALACTEKLSKILSAKTYQPSKFEVFYVYDPKKRLVQAPAFVDKVVLHAIVDNILYDIFTNRFIRDNYASQKGKGTHDGLLRLRQFMVEYYRKNGSADGWVLKCDVRHFFASINHDKLKVKLWEILEKNGVDREIYDLLCIYIDTTEGLPLGYQTSQLFALLFLDEFDHIVKERFRQRYYGRYMDDFFVINSDKNELRKLLAFFREFMSDCGLELNQKTGIFPLRNGLDFLGFHTYIDDNGAVIQKLRQSSIDRMNSKVKFWEKEYPKGTLDKERIKAQHRSWDAHAAHGDTYSLRKKYAERVSKIIGEEVKPTRKINAPKNVRTMRQISEMRKRARKDAKAKAETVIEQPRSGDSLPWQ